LDNRQGKRVKLQVFHDPTGMRGRRLKWLGFGLALAAILSAAVVRPGPLRHSNRHRHRSWPLCSPGDADAFRIDSAALPTASTSSRSFRGRPLRSQLGAPQLTPLKLLASTCHGMRPAAAPRVPTSASCPGSLPVSVSVRGRGHQWIQGTDDASLPGVLAGQPPDAAALDDTRTTARAAGTAKLWRGCSPVRKKRHALLEKVAAAITKHKAAGVFFDNNNLPASSHRDYRALFG